MSTSPVTVYGRIRPGGTLEVTQRVDLPPGPVQVTVEPSPGSQSAEDTRSVLRRIWARRQTRGAIGRTKEEIDAEINAMRNEDERRMREIEQIGRQTPGKQE